MVTLAVVTRPARRRAGTAVAVAVGAGLLTALVRAVLGLSTAGPPWSVALWVALAAGALSLAAGGWSHGWAPRAAALWVVLLCALMAAGSLNAAAGRYPTLQRLLHLDAENVADGPALRAAEAQARNTGSLPAQGLVVIRHIPPSVSGFSAQDALVYVPPAWFTDPRPHLPTVVLLPGEPGSSSDWVDDGDADSIADRFAAAHGGRAPLLVMPDPNGTKTVDSECVNSQFGEAETYLTVDVPDFMRRAFGAADGPRSFAIAGLSAGGSCAVILALRHPALYPTFASYSGFDHPIYQDEDRAATIRILFGGSTNRYLAHDPVTLLERRSYPGTAGWFEVGDADSRPRAAAETLQPLARAAGIDTCILVRRGGHDFGLWSQALTDSLPWLSWRLGLTGPPAPVPADCRPPVP